MFKSLFFTAPREEEMGYIFLFLFFLTDLGHVQAVFPVQHKNILSLKFFGVLWLNCLPDSEIVSPYEIEPKLKQYFIYYFSL